MSLISFSRDKFIPSDDVSLSVRGNYLSITRGYQVFTFFKTANNGIPVFLDDHVDRIVGNAQAMKMNLSYSKQDIKGLVHQTLEKNDFSKSECNVMIIFAGKAPDDISGLVSSQEVDLFIVTSPIKKYPKESYQNGISLGLYEFERIDAEVKTPYTYYGGMKAHRSLVHEGPFDEALYTSKDEILEGTTFSFFIVKNGFIKEENKWSWLSNKLENKKDNTKKVQQTNKENITETTTFFKTICQHFKAQKRRHFYILFG